MTRWIAILFVLLLCCAMITCVSASDYDYNYDYEDEYEEEQSDGISATSILISVGIGILLTFLIPMSILKGQLKSVAPENAAANYVREGSMNLTKQQDIYLYHNVARTPIAKNNNRK